MLKEYRVKLDEFQEYKRSVDERVRLFEEKIAKSEEEVEILGNEYAKSFISGNETDDKKLKKLKNELAEDKKQLDLIIEARDSDPKLVELANKVYHEFTELNQNKWGNISDLIKEVEELEGKLSVKKQELNTKKALIKNEEKDLAKERLDIIPYMEIGIRDKNKLSMVATSYSYDNYLRNKDIWDR